MSASATQDDHNNKHIVGPQMLARVSRDLQGLSVSFAMFSLKC